MKKQNKDLKKIYSAVFKSGYEKTYSLVYTPAVVKGLDLTEEIKEVLRAGRPWRGKEVVDVGCGTGLFAYAAAAKGARVLGIDYIPEAIAIAKRRYQHPNLTYTASDAASLTGRYDIIVSIGTLEHMDNPFKTLCLFKRHLKPAGKIILTCPNWTNPRGYILQTLRFLFDAPITLADLHYLTPIEFQEWAEKLKMDLKWKTFDKDWAHGERLIKDFERRLPNVLIRDMKLKLGENVINDFITWIKDHIVALDHSTPWSGATGLYIYNV